MFNLNFPTDTSDVKFRAVQWICTEVLLALAAIVNFLPRKLFLLLSSCYKANSHSEIIPVDLLHLLSSGHPGFLAEYDLAADWGSQHLGLPFHA